MEQDEMDCPHCGNALDPGVRTCPCGFSFTENETHVPAPAIVRTRIGNSQDTDVATAVHPARPVTGGMPQPNEALLMDCPACTARISKRAERCPKCGRAPYEHCQICASRILTNAVSCPECGDPLPFGG